MSTQKRKQKSLHDLLSYMHMLDDGISFSHIHKNYGINEERLKVLWSRYQKEGISGLQKRPNINADYALKRKIVLDIEENHLTLHEASLKYGASPQRIGVWLKIMRTEGIDALSNVKSVADHHIWEDRKRISSQRVSWKDSEKKTRNCDWR